MHIQEGTNTTLTTCTKMTEEVDRRHGVNGNSSGKAVTEDVPVHNSALNATGGRLKFFKDGKFILELVRGQAREGERAGWVSVPRKTFWPPAAAPPTPPGAAPPASLSVSDDNSSVHSSPWQRDHCWKQAAPRKNLSRHLAMYYCRPSALVSPAIEAVSRAKRRRPYDPSDHDALLDAALGVPRRPALNGVCDRRNGERASPRPAADDAVDGAAPHADDCDREKYYHMKLKKPYQYRKLRVYKKTRPARRRRELARTICRLTERAPAAAPAPVNAKLASCRQEHAMVSPRKRILRELERVSLEDQSMKRRARTAPALSTASYPPSPGPSRAAPPAAEPPPPRRDPPPSKNVSSYSIHSLLSIPDESPTRRSPEAKRSPHSYPPSLKTESPSSVTSPDLSPSPDGYRYRYAGVGGSPGHGVARDSPTPPQYRAPYAPAAYGAAARAWPGGVYRGREDWFPPYQYPYLAHVYRAPPAPLWMQYAVPPAPSPWAPLPLPLLTDHIPKDEHTSDLPLNLSKH